MKKAAIVGCGGISAVHAAVLNELEGVKLVACADIRPERAAALAEKYGLHAYDSLEKMLDAEEIDVLHICTPHYLHVPMIAQAHRRGIHVFTEKPPAISSEQRTELFAMASDGGARIGVCFQNRYIEAACKLKTMVESGETGKILGIRGFVTWTRDERYYLESGWRGKLATEGGGALINQSIHTMDLMNFFMGRPKSVEAVCQNRHLKGIIEVEDTVDALIDYSGVPGVFFATTAYGVNSPVLIELSCENMTLRMEETEVMIKRPGQPAERISYDRPSLLGKDYWGAGHHLCIADFYRCLEENLPFQNDVPGIKNTLDLMLAVYESAGKGGAPVLL